MRRLDDERGGVGRLFRDGLDVRQVCRLAQQRAEFRMIVLVGNHSELQRLLGGQVALLANVAHGRDGLLEQFDLFEQRFVAGGGFGHRCERDALAVAPRRDVLPDFLRDERHERMQHPHQFVEKSDRGVEPSAGR